MRVPKINTTLYANAVFSVTSGVVFLLFPGFLAESIIELPSIVFLVLGIGLLLFALDVYLTARKNPPSRGKVLYIFGADVAWVVGTPIALLLLADRMTSLGVMLFIDIAVIVAVFAALEWFGLAKLTEETSAA